MPQPQQPQQPQRPAPQAPGQAQPNAGVSQAAIMNWLKQQNLDPSQPTVAIKHPVTGEVMLINNPAYDPLAAKKKSADDDDDDGDDDKSWCSIVNNWCPESSMCVWWIVPEGAESDSDGGCVQVSDVIARQQEASARADLFDKITQTLDAVLTGDSKTSALASLVSQLTTSLQLRNEQRLMEEAKLKKKKQMRREAEMKAQAEAAKKVLAPDDDDSEDTLDAENLLAAE